ncbi:aminotransferase class I/II-fold pyridoxal phosphate-dependent enzyme [Microbacter sp. GSS18]|nr:aminotransferase class I/II-fold pyridoxal phosphate-dependent enzyme [Microbacter sp. GSS18]
MDKVISFLQRMSALASDEDALDFTFGNPHEMALPGLVDAMRGRLEPRSVDWYAYKTNEPAAREAIASGLRDELGLDIEPDDIAMTQGAFGAISLALALIADVGDEVVIPTPGWFCYTPMLYATNLTPVEAPLDPDTFDLDIAAVARAITPRTRVVIVNSPSNPTGRVFPKQTCDELAELLEEMSRRHGRRIWILSDEPYRRIRFDGIGFDSPAASYPWTMIDYSYGKVLLAPGQRIGYLALSPLLPRADREELRGAFMTTQLAIGWGFPNALMQYSAPALESVSIDMDELTRKRDRMVAAMEDAGFALTRPEGTFYLWGRAPGGDGAAFCDALSARGVHLMPGTMFDQPAHFRVALTATMETIDRALPTISEVGASFS